MEKEKEKDNYLIMMEVIIMETLKLISLMVLVKCNIKMEKIMKVNGKIVKNKEVDCIII